jgi:hypothetical protein
VTCVTCDACPFLDSEFVRNRDESVLSGEVNVVQEEYKKSACEDLTCDLKTLCVL